MQDRLRRADTRSKPIMRVDGQRKTLVKGQENHLEISPTIECIRPKSLVNVSRRTIEIGPGEATSRILNPFQFSRTLTLIVSCCVLVVSVLTQVTVTAFESRLCGSTYIDASHLIKVKHQQNRCRSASETAGLSRFQFCPPSLTTWNWFK